MGTARAGWKYNGHCPSFLQWARHVGHDAQEVISAFDQAAELNRRDSRQGNLLTLPSYGQVVMTGDLHGHYHNFRKLQAFASLEKYPDRHVVLHEMIHCLGQESAGEDDSCRLLIEAARWKVRFPDQVHMLLGNHGIAQITGREISKGGGASVAGFSTWVCQKFIDHSDGVLEAVLRYGPCPRSTYTPAHRAEGPQYA